MYKIKPVLSGQSKRRPKIGFQDQLWLNAGHKYCRMLQKSILQYFQPSLSYHLSLRPLFCLFLSGCIRQILLYIEGKWNREIYRSAHMNEQNVQLWQCYSMLMWFIFLRRPKTKLKVIVLRGIDRKQIKPRPAFLLLYVNTKRLCNVFIVLPVFAENESLKIWHVLRILALIYHFDVVDPRSWR